MDLRDFSFARCVSSEMIFAMLQHVLDMEMYFYYGLYKEDMEAILDMNTGESLSGWFGELMYFLQNENLIFILK